VPNLVKVMVANGGKFSLYNAVGSTDVVADVVGWYPDSVPQPSPRPANAWVREQPAIPPDARDQPVIAFDSTRNESVLFGGFDPNVDRFIADDTWVWDGRVWTERWPTLHPSARSRGAFASDAQHGQLVLFGGLDSFTRLLNDTWTWDGSTWLEKHPAQSPPARMHASMSYDPATGHVILFGGETLVQGSSGVESLPLGDTWSWDGATWTQLFPSSSPAPRDLAGIAAFPPTNSVLLFGGETETGGSWHDLADTWTWDGNNWHLVSTLSSAPRARVGPAMAYDGNGHVMLESGLFLTGDGSRTGFVGGDNWIWDSTQWHERFEGQYPCSQVCPTPPGDEPGGRYVAAAAQEPGTGVVLFSGASSQTMLGLPDTWTWKF